MSRDTVPRDAISVADVVFAEATPRQRTLSWELNGASWAPPMSLAEYIGREQTLSETPLSTGGGTRYWVLHHKDNADAIVSACEVTAKKALVADGSSAEPRVVDAYSIASVFTNPRFRGNGMANHLLRKVQDEVDAAGAECGALYSDIGRTFYTGLGWPDFPSPQLTFKLEAGFDPATLPTATPAVSLLAEADVAALCDRDVEAVTAKFRGLAGDGRTHLTFLPSFIQCAWHFARDAYVARVMRNGRETPHRGARTADGAAWLYWDHDLREKKLKVLRIVTDPADPPAKRTADIAALLRAALAEARDWDLPKVLVWSPGPEACVAATEIWREAGDKLHVVLDERQDGSIPSLRWKSGKDLGSGQVVWEDNEYFSWC